MFYGGVLGLGLAAKRFYAGAGADELRFVLEPTAALVEGLTGERFEREAGVGWVSRELAFAIAPACAGINYLVIAFWLLVLGFAARVRTSLGRAAFALGAAALAFGATLLVNALRIALSIELAAWPHPAWLSPAASHRALGVAVYLGSLWALGFGGERALALRRATWQRALLPLAPYLGVTLLLPALNGAAVRAGFAEHARAVLGVSLALTAAALASAAVFRRVARNRAPPIARK
jgi:exosortase K